MFEDFPGHASDVPAAVSLASLSQGLGFRADRRFAPGMPACAPQPPEPDAAQTAYADGFAAGIAQARAEMEARHGADENARAALMPAFRRLDEEARAGLSRDLRDIVAALCEETLAPMAMDENALVRRIDAALALLSESGPRTICLNPMDLALVADDAPDDWRFRPDPALERGALRVETADGGIEDGPASWRQRIAEALDR